MFATVRSLAPPKHRPREGELAGRPSSPAAAVIGESVLYLEGRRQKAAGGAEVCKPRSGTSQLPFSEVTPGAARALEQPAGRRATITGAR